MALETYKDTNLTFTTVSLLVYINTLRTHDAMTTTDRCIRRRMAAPHV